MGARQCISAVHQCEKAVWMYCKSESHKGLHEAEIRPRERQGRDRQAAALTVLCADAAFDLLRFCSCDVLLLSLQYIWLLVMVTSLIHLINYGFIPNL